MSGTKIANEFTSHLGTAAPPKKEDVQPFQPNSVFERTSQSVSEPSNLEDLASSKTSVASSESKIKTWLETGLRHKSATSIPEFRSSLASGPGALYHTRSKSSNISRTTVSDRSQSIMRSALDDMTNSELLRTVQDLQKKTKRMELENIVFLHFLEAHDPTLLEDMHSTLKNVQTMQERASASSRRLTLSRASRRESMFMTESSSFVSHLPATEKEGPKINVTQKTDLVLREMDDIEESLRKFNKKCNVIRHKLKAELEEMGIREYEIKETMNTFEGAFIYETIEKYALKNPADRFARFMEECFKRDRTIIDKIRLRASSLKVQYQKTFNQLTQKKLLGENLQEVDFEQLQIENKHLATKIDQRNLLLLELKKMNGNANLLLSRIKKHLLRKLDELKEIQDTIKFREDLIVKLDAECEKVAVELEDTKSEYDKIKTKSENYHVPAVLDYVKKKAELDVLKKNLKVWSRRKQVKDMALIASVREMKHTTGLRKSKPSWFATSGNFLGGDESIEAMFEFKFEREANERDIQKKKKSSRRVFQVS